MAWRGARFCPLFGHQKAENNHHKAAWEAAARTPRALEKADAGDSLKLPSPAVFHGNMDPRLLYPHPKPPFFLALHHNLLSVCQ